VAAANSPLDFSHQLALVVQFGLLGRDRLANVNVNRR